MRRTVVASLALLAAAALGAQEPSQAHPPAPEVRSMTSKVFLFGGPGGSTVKVEGSNEVEAGRAFTLGLGYGFTRNLAVFVGAEFAAMGSDPDSLGAMGHFDLGARFHFADPARQWIPFLDVALTGLALSSPGGVQGCTPTGCITGETEHSGAGWTFGGGVMYYAMPKFAITGSLRWTVASFSLESVNGVPQPGDSRLDATSTRLTLGFAWFPSR